MEGRRRRQRDSERERGVTIKDLKNRASEEVRVIGFGHSFLFLSVSCRFLLLGWFFVE